MATITKENIGELHDKLIVKVSKEDYYPSFEKAVKDYSKRANIPGFRKGMVPAGMIKKMYGASIFYDEVVKAVEKELQTYLTTEKPQIFAQPLPMESDMSKINMANPEEYEFPFELGVKPEVKLDSVKTANPTLYKVLVTDKMVDDEVEKLVTKYGEMKDADEVTVPENVLNVTFEESDAEGNVAEGAAKKDNSILVKYFAESFRDQVYGKKKGDAVVLQLQNAFDEKEREWIVDDLGLDKDDPGADMKYFRMTIEKVALVEKKDLNEDLFKIVLPGHEIKTEEEFRAALKEDLQKQWDQLSRTQLHDQLYHHLVDSPMSFPDQFLKRWLAIGGEKKKSDEEVESEYPTFTNQLKWTLISDKILNENNLNVTNEELRDQLRKDIMQYFGQMNLGEDTSWIESYIDRMMHDEKQIESTHRKILTEKMFQWLDTQVTPEEKEVAPEELLAKQHHHQH